MALSQTSSCKKGELFLVTGSFPNVLAFKVDLDGRGMAVTALGPGLLICKLFRVVMGPGPDPVLMVDSSRGSKLGGALFCDLDLGLLVDTCPSPIYILDSGLRLLVTRARGPYSLSLTWVRVTAIDCTRQPATPATPRRQARAHSSSRVGPYFFLTRA